MAAHTLLLMTGGREPTSKHSGGRYQYVPAPWLVSSRPLEWPSSTILLSPKSCQASSKPAQYAVHGHVHLGYAYSQSPPAQCV